MSVPLEPNVPFILTLGSIRLQFCVWNGKIVRNVIFFQILKKSLSCSARETVRDMAAKDGELRVFIVAGEVSGDIIASRFMNSLKKLSAFPVRFTGVGGLEKAQTKNGGLKTVEKNLGMYMGYRQDPQSYQCSLEVDYKRTHACFQYFHTLELLKNDFSELTAVIYVAPNKQVEDYIRKAVSVWPAPVVMVPDVTSCIKYNAFSASRVALCASGTAAVELQLARLPCVVAYQAHVPTEWFIRHKAKIPCISLPNIILNSALVPEALFGACTPSHLALLLRDLMNDESLGKKTDGCCW